jgi:ribosomal protein L12E/L44/L45/RPP1/RPP2
VTPDQLIPIIRQEYQEDIQDSLRGRSAKEIEEFLGKDILDVLRKGRVAAAKPPVPVRSAIKDVAAKKPEAKTEKKVQTMKEFFGV